jgi:hypothetical protein
VGHIERVAMRAFLDIVRADGREGEDKESYRLRGMLLELLQFGLM